MTDRQTTVLDARAIDRTLRRMADEIVELNDGTDDLDHRRHPAPRRAARGAHRVASIARAREASTCRSGALDITLYRDDLQTVGPRPVVGPTRSPVGDRRQARRHRRRRALHRPHRARRARRAGGLRPADAHRAGRADRPRRTRAADPARRRRQDASRSRRRERVDVLVAELDGADAVVVADARRTRRDALARQGPARARAADAASRFDSILDTAEPFKEISERAIKKVPTLRGSTIVNLFFEASTRTRVSFEFAEKRLSADTVNVAASGSSVSARARRWSTRRATSRRCGSTWS